MPGSLQKFEQDLLLLMIFVGKQRITFSDFYVPPNELNRKGKTGRFPTFLTIRPWKKPKEVKRLKLRCHGIVRCDLMPFFIRLVDEIFQPLQNFIGFLLILDFCQCNVENMEGN